MSSIFGAISKQRLRRAGKRISVPVICVGNFTAGGSGKTPFVRFLVGELRARGESPWILSRGYGGSVTSPTRVDRNVHNVRDVGDEPLMLAAVAPVIVCRDRLAGAEYACQSDLAPDVCGPSVLVMDDGLQNPALHKTLTFAVVDRSRGIGNGLVIPSGPLRAPLAPQLTHPDAIILSGVDAPEHASIARIRETFQGPVLNTVTAPDHPPTEFKGQRAVVFAGIANPERVRALASTLGADVVATRYFRDHHPFVDADCDALAKLAATHGARLLTTEKDYVRLATSSLRCRALAEQVGVLRIASQPDAFARTQLGALLKRALSRRDF